MITPLRGPCQVDPSTRQLAAEVIKQKRAWLRRGQRQGGVGGDSLPKRAEPQQTLLGVESVPALVNLQPT